MGKLTEEKIEQAAASAYARFGEVRNHRPFNWDSLTTAARNDWKDAVEAAAPHLQYISEPIDGDLHDQACAAFIAAKELALEEHTSMLHGPIDAVICVCLDAALGSVSDEDEEIWELWRDDEQPSMKGVQWTDHMGVNKLLASRRSRLLRKEPEERITVEEVHTTPLNYSSDCAFTVTFDGKPSGPLHSCRKYAEIYADGLRFRLAKEKEAK